MGAHMKMPGIKMRHASVSGAGIKTGGGGLRPRIRLRHLALAGKSAFGAPPKGAAFGTEGPTANPDAAFGPMNAGMDASAGEMGE